MLRRVRVLFLTASWVLLLHTVSDKSSVPNETDKSRVSSVHRLSHRGKTVTLAIAHHGRIHSDKKSNGRTYHRWIDIKHEIPADIENETLVVSSLMVNMANPKDDILAAMIEAMDLGVTHSPWTQGKDLVDFFRPPLGSMTDLVPGIDVAGLWSRFAGRLKNADGPVWYSNIVLTDVGAQHAGKIWDGSCTRSGMTHNAVYEVEWKVIRD